MIWNGLNISLLAAARVPNIEAFTQELIDK